MSGTAFFVEIRQHDLDALRQQLKPSTRYLLCPVGARRYWLAGREVRQQSPHAVAPSDWLAISALTETPEHFFLVLAEREAHVIPKRALDSTVASALEELVRTIEPLAAAGNAAGGTASPTDQPRSAGLIVALGVGLRLSLPWPLRPDAVNGRGGPLILVALAAVLFGFLSAVDYVTVPEPRQLNLWSFALDATWLLMLLVGLYVPVRLLSARAGSLERVLTLLAGAALVPLLIGKLYVSYDVGQQLAGLGVADADWFQVRVYYVWLGWITFIVWRAFTVVVPLGSTPRVAMGLYLAGVVVLISGAVPTLPVWFTVEELGRTRTGSAGSDELAYDLDVERTYYAQSRLLDAALLRLAPQRAGMTDLYFVGFAGDAQQDVFMREVQNFRRFLDTERDTRNRSILLINHPEVVATVPLANRHNLGRTLRHLGAVIDPAEDVVFLYLTSHGSPDGRFAVHFPPLQLADLRPQQLRTVLRESGIRWRVVAVSACFSGTFLEPLSGPNTLVMTAARADRSSFGCENGRDFTYFGEALRSGLAQTRSFSKAFEIARLRVTGREKAEGKDPSYPQMNIGRSIEAKLSTLELPP